MDIRKIFRADYKSGAIPYSGQSVWVDPINHLIQADGDFYKIGL